MLLAFFSGSFGIDQFYAHLWPLAVFKLLTGGGLGLWSLIDAVLWTPPYLLQGTNQYLLAVSTVLSEELPWPSVALSHGDQVYSRRLQLQWRRR